MGNLAGIHRFHGLRELKTIDDLPKDLNVSLESPVGGPPSQLAGTVGDSVDDTYPTWLRKAGVLTEIDVHIDENLRIAWLYMHPRGRPSFTTSMLGELHAVADLMEQAFAHRSSDTDLPIRYVVLGSRVPGIYNLGGDLALFRQLIEEGDSERLRKYAHMCVKSTLRVDSGFNLPMCMIALVQGDALGGGFEAALSHDVIIAEKSAKFGLPEILFNLFPGMGAYNFLSRKIGPAHAERMILSGKVYTAEELHDMGIIDEIAEDGEGETATEEYVARFERSRGARSAILRSRKLLNPVTEEDMIAIADLWVETAMALQPQDLRKMQHLAKAQERRWAKLHSLRSSDQRATA